MAVCRHYLAVDAFYYWDLVVLALWKERVGKIEGAAGKA